MKRWLKKLSLLHVKRTLKSSKNKKLKRQLNKLKERREKKTKNKRKVQLNNQQLLTILKMLKRNSQKLRLLLFHQYLPLHLLKERKKMISQHLKVMEERMIDTFGHKLWKNFTFTFQFEVILIRNN